MYLKPVSKNKQLQVSDLEHRLNDMGHILNSTQATDVKHYITN